METDNGAVLSGIADMIVETPKGLWIIDHKSDRVEETDQRFTEHLPQLLAYREALSAVNGMPSAVGVAINWIYRGELQFAELPEVES